MKLAVSFHAAEAYSESFQTSKTELFVKKINGFQLLTGLQKTLTSDVLQRSECTSFQLTININKPYTTKANHRRTLMQAE